jgi:hypothetical protein
MGREKVMYFDELIRKEMRMGEFSEMESTDEIVEYIREKALDDLEQQTDFMEEYPIPIYTEMRLDYLTYIEEERHYNLLVDLYFEKELTNHLMDIQRQAIEFIRTEKPAMMKAWKIEDENDPHYKAMNSALREMVIKAVVES